MIIFDDLLQIGSTRHLLADHLQPAGKVGGYDLLHIVFRDFLPLHQDQGFGLIDLGDDQNSC